MKQEILYRGKRIDNGEWVYGFPIFYKAGQVGIAKVTDAMRIIPANDGSEVWDIQNLFCPKISRETLSQYIGLPDKNGNKIFDDDIVKVEWYDGDGNYIISNGVIGYNEKTCCYCIYLREYFCYLDIALHPEMEVVGNVFDNPNL